MGPSICLLRERCSRLVAAIVATAILLLAVNAAAADPDRVEWSRDWPRVRLVEGLDTLALGIASLSIPLVWKPQETPRWRGGILFDDTVRDALRGRTYDVQSTFTTLGDVLYYGSFIAPFVIDVWVVALGIHQSSDVALQMTLIDAQSLAITGTLVLAAGHGVGRARPYVQDCGPGGMVRDASGQPLFNTCGGKRDTESFFSGHAASTATMAGLTCAHHQHLQLYGGGFADLAPCLVMIGASLTSGVSRIVGDHHWSSDVLLGWTIGALSGYVLPSVLHYGFSNGEPIGQVRVGDARFVPVPQAFPDGAGLGIVGIY